MKVKNLIPESLYYVTGSDEKWRFSHLNTKGVPVWYPDGGFDFEDSFVDYEWESKVLCIFKERDGLTVEDRAALHQSAFNKTTNKMKDLTKFADVV